MSNADIYVNGELVGRGAEGMAAALARMLAPELHTRDTPQGTPTTPDTREHPARSKEHSS